MYREQVAALNKEIVILKEKAEKAGYTKDNENFTMKMELESIDRGFNTTTQLLDRRTALRKRLDEEKAKFTEGESDYYQLMRDYARESALLDLEVTRVQADLGLSISSALNFSKELSKETVEEKILEKINEDIKSSSMFDFDLSAIWDSFDSLDGISKLVCFVMFSNYVVLSCIFSILINLYGNYLMEKYNLEERYPKIAFFIKYRRKLSKYYIFSNFLFIIITCFTNMGVGIAILSIYYI